MDLDVYMDRALELVRERFENPDYEPPLIDLVIEAARLYSYENEVPFDEAYNLFASRYLRD